FHYGQPRPVVRVGAIDEPRADGNIQFIRPRGAHGVSGFGRRSDQYERQTRDRLPVGQSLLRASAMDRRVHIERDWQLPARDDARLALDDTVDGNGESDVRGLVVGDEVGGSVEILDSTRQVSSR